MIKNDKLQVPTLGGQDAIGLWQQGNEQWNNWVDLHPHWHIDFSFTDFSNSRDHAERLSFQDYHFHERAVSFNHAIFGDGFVSFDKATFVNSYVNFCGANFGVGNVSFGGTQFGDGVLDFSFASFDKGIVGFVNATFGDGFVDFSNVEFVKGDAIFSNVNFGNCHVNFSSANFGDGDAIFSGAKFGDGDITFVRAKIGRLLFNPESIRGGGFKARELTISGMALFELPSGAEALTSFDLHSASFDGPLMLSGNLGIVPDLRATRYSHHVDLSALSVRLQRQWQGIGWPPKLSFVAKDPEDGAKLRRLKEIAETNKDHQAALRFSADENRAKRWIETSWPGSVLDMAFSHFSDYGQSILRPFIWLFVVFAASVISYKAFATALCTNIWTPWFQAGLLSASNSLPILPQSRSLRANALEALYGHTPSLTVDAIMIIQGALSFIFLFLIGLGLRNRFRL